MKIEHIALYVSDLEASRHFYESWFGGKSGRKYINPRKKFASYFLTFSGGCRLEIMTKEGLSSPPGEGEFPGFTHMAFGVDSREEVDRLTEELRTGGVIIAGEPRETGDGYYESLVLDPDGNRLEIVSH